MKWCPFPGCTNAIRCERVGRRGPVKCACGSSFCFRCADSSIGDHTPVPCEPVIFPIYNIHRLTFYISWKNGYRKLRMNQRM